MVLVDTSVWIDHFRNENDRLVKLLNNGEVFSHPFIIGEIACGKIKNRLEIITSLQSLPQSLIVDHEEVMLFIEKKKIMGQGLGYIDITLLVSSILTGIPLWTLDKRLNEIARKFDIHHEF